MKGLLLIPLILCLLWPAEAWGQSKGVKWLKPGSKEYQKLHEDLLKKVAPSKEIKGGWFVEGPTYHVHTTISREYAVATAIHLHRFRERFRAIFRGEFKDNRIPVAYAFATEKQYLAFSPEVKGTQGRFAVNSEGNETVKDLAWFSSPPGETDFYKTDYGVVQHEATHQLLDAYTDNQRIPAWFNEGCATFFEDWDLDKGDKENILSGIEGRYGLGICLSYPRQKPAPPMAEFWVDLREMFERHEFKKLVLPAEKWPPDPEEGLEFKKHMVVQQQYNEAWSIITFLIHHERTGRQYFEKFLVAFREGGGPNAVKAKYLTEDFLKPFEKAWEEFLKGKVLRKWEFPTVGGKKLQVGDSQPPPAGTEGHPLDASGRGDLFLVQAEAATALAPPPGEEWWMLKAWSVPIQFYVEAWKKMPQHLSQNRTVLISGAYVLGEHHVSEAPGMRAFFLLPTWSSLELDEAFAERLDAAARALIARAREGKAAPKQEGKKPEKKAEKKAAKG